MIKARSLMEPINNTSESVVISISTEGSKVIPSRAPYNSRRISGLLKSRENTLSLYSRFTPIMASKVNTTVFSGRVQGKGKEPQTKEQYKGGMSNEQWKIAV
jgi:hypothetical protein